MSEREMSECDHSTQDYHLHVSRCPVCDAAALQSAQEKIERLERDAARYRWLRQKGALMRAAHIAVLTHNGGYVAEEETADAAIDAAIDAATQNGEGVKG